MTNTIVKWSEQQLRNALSLLPDKAFAQSAEFLAFLEQVRTFVAPAVVGKARSWGYDMEPTDAEHMIYLKLVTEAGQHPTGETRYIADYVAEAVNPWDYLGGCATHGWLRDEYGIRGADLSGDIEFLSDSHSNIWIPGPGGEDKAYTDLWEAVDLTYELLKPRTPKELHRDLYELLKFLGANPTQRISYEHHEREAAKQYCEIMTEEQIAAVMNIAWGARPNREETSIMAQFLLNSEFKLSSSPRHARAVRMYQAKMSALHNRARVLK